MCERNHPGGPDDLCVGATETCPTKGNLRYWVFRRIVFPNGNRGRWIRLPGTFCRGGTPQGTPQITGGDIRDAFRWRFVPIPGSHTRVDPKNGTVVNIETIFYATTPRTLRPHVTILGRRVALTLHPRRWTWHFGDGSTLTTRTPGAPYPSRAVTHRYHVHGVVHAVVVVTWGGTFRFGGRTFAIPGTTSRGGPPTRIVIHQAHTVLIQ